MTTISGQGRSSGLNSKTGSAEDELPMTRAAAPRFLETQARMDAALRASSDPGRAAALPFPAFKSLLDVCRNQAGGDEQRAGQCVAISDTMYAHSDTLIPFAN
jgi:hypothetical protein